MHTLPQLSFGHIALCGYTRIYVISPGGFHIAPMFNTGGMPPGRHNVYVILLTYYCAGRELYSQGLWSWLCGGGPMQADYSKFVMVYVCTYYCAGRELYSKGLWSWLCGGGPMQADYSKFVMVNEKNYCIKNEKN